MDAPPDPALDPDRPVTGRDLRAALDAFGPPDADRAAFRDAVAADAVFRSLAELRDACPPGRAGLSPGRYAALFEPLFGEFE
jgi:hypothetical protein